MHASLIYVDEVTIEDISPCDKCGKVFKLGDDLMLVPQPDGTSECWCLDCVEVQ